MEEQKMNETTYEQPQANVKTGLATVALVFGILAFITTLIFVNYLFGLIAFVCAIVFLVKNRDVKVGKVKAIVGLVLALVSVIIATSLWISIYIYFTTTDLNTMLEDVSGVVENVTGGEINLEETITATVNDAIENVVVDVPAIQEVEKVLGKEINYDTLKEFVGEDLSLEKVKKFVGDGIDESKIEEVIATVDYTAVMESLDNELTYQKLEEKIGEDFTYDDLMEYLEGFKK